MRVVTQHSCGALPNHRPRSPVAALRERSLENGLVQLAGAPLRPFLHLTSIY